MLQRNMLPPSSGYIPLDREDWGSTYCRNTAHFHSVSTQEQNQYQRWTTTKALNQSRTRQSFMNRILVSVVTSKIHYAFLTQAALCLTAKQIQMYHQHATKAEAKNMHNNISMLVCAFTLYFILGCQYLRLHNDNWHQDWWIGKDSKGSRHGVKHCPGIRLLEWLIKSQEQHKSGQLVLQQRFKPGTSSIHIYSTNTTPTCYIMTSRCGAQTKRYFFL